MLPITVAFVLLGGAISWALSHPRFLLYPLQCVFLWLLLRFSIPRQGLIARRFFASPENTSLLIFLFLWYAVGVASGIGFVVFASAFSTPALVAAATITCILWFIGFGYGLHRIDLPRQKRLKLESQNSVDAWDQIHLKGSEPL